VTTTTRSEALPDVPAVGEFVPDYEASGWNALLNKEINAALADCR
jgi:hypothetical protein